MILKSMSQELLITYFNFNLSLIYFNHMDEIDDLQNEFEEINDEIRDLHFNCPNCGDINQDNVVFLCNTCDSKEMLYKDGVYVCPQCLNKGNNFMCMTCDSKEVRLTSKL